MSFDLETYVRRLAPHFEFRARDNRLWLFICVLLWSCIFLLMRPYSLVERTLPFSLFSPLSQVRFELAAAEILLPSSSSSLSFAQARTQAYSKRLVRLARQEPSAVVTALSAHEALALFGKPFLTREAQTSVMWQYGSHECVLDLYFLTEKEEGELGKEDIVYVEIRTTGGDVLLSGKEGEMELNGTKELRGNCLKSLIPSEGRTATGAERG